MEQKYMPNSTTLAQVNKRIAKGQPLRADSAYPDPILFFCHKDYDQFKKLWVQLQDQPNVSLDQLFKVDQQGVWT
jgi:hypothetical protein